jgi:hypothetical protein
LRARHTGTHLVGRALPKGEDRDFFVARGRNATILRRLFIARSRRF